MLDAATIADGNRSEKKMEGDDGLRTLECLRGRLLAERAASRAAKEEAELMGNKLIQLENQLKEETKSRNRVQKKLKSLMAKLESLNISYVWEDSERWISPENSEITSGSPTTSSNLNDPEEKEPKSHLATSHDVSDSPCNPVSDIDSTGDDPSKSGEFKHNQTAGDSTTHDNHSSSSSKSSVAGEEISGKNDQNWEENEECVDNSLALVPASREVASQSHRELKMVNGGVGDVLAALQHAKEKLQSSMVRRHLAGVGLLRA
ncbi:uncharacterized protein LOC131168556 [Malania oleifera]|uniref:uncharacterized protein LOC131168556 n=1 Tax=Malania oleifera TaxID=397392 RepID=UPI0025AE9E1E|nr:uncharacterized protein LOC131168556 [Malania oleifera]